MSATCRASSFKADDRLKLAFFSRDHRQAAGVRHQRPVLHARRREAAGRARPRRAGPPDHRSRAGGRRRRGVPVPRRAQVPGREPRRPRLRRAGGRDASPTPARASRCSTSSRPTRRVRSRAVEGEHVAIIGENRKLLIFPLEQVPEMTRGRGVRLQRYKDGGLSDVKTFKAADGLTWLDAADRTFTLTAQGARRLARQPRRRRPPRPEGIPAQQQVRPRAGERAGRGVAATPCGRPLCGGTPWCAIRTSAGAGRPNSCTGSALSSSCCCWRMAGG